VPENRDQGIGRIGSVKKRIVAVFIRESGCGRGKNEFLLFLIFSWGEVVVVIVVIVVELVDLISRTISALGCSQI